MVLCYLPHEPHHVLWGVYLPNGTVVHIRATDSSGIARVCKYKFVLVLDEDVGRRSSRIEDVRGALLFNVVFVYDIE